ncbi:hypothetical protein D7Z26_04265 [Cohnella endophytica]|uniref:DZANK-type domain-containing protein n=1 Tax=Cohnella endophytica TaxID=2419778 RepID=A0A494Y3D7_9BACL|nr:zinc ribbon domain-containing protein [Cohnella endophytica]RKP57204.1 hypothetical protein D7Z26_04265 [Cohnella endophytica]
MSFFKNLKETVSKGVSTATEKAQQTVEVTRLNAQISGKRKEIEKLFAIIGESVYEGYQVQDLSQAEAKVLPRCAEITAIQEEISALNDRIKAIRNEKDCVCGNRVSADTKFCPSCGNRFPDPVIVKDPIQVDPYLPESEHADYPDGEVSEEAVRVDQRQVCKSCGTPLYADSHFCPACGQATQ